MCHRRVLFRKPFSECPSIVGDAHVFIIFIILPLWAQPLLLLFYLAVFGFVRATCRVPTHAAILVWEPKTRLGCHGVIIVWSPSVHQLLTISEQKNVNDQLIRNPIISFLSWVIFEKVWGLFIEILSPAVIQQHSVCKQTLSATCLCWDYGVCAATFAHICKGSRVAYKHFCPKLYTVQIILKRNITYKNGLSTALDRCPLKMLVKTSQNNMVPIQLTSVILVRWSTCTDSTG